MGKLGVTHIVISIPRLAVGAIAVGLLVGGTQLIPAPSQANPLQVSTTSQSKPSTPYTAAPRSLTQPAPAPAPTETTPVPQSITLRSASPGPVVTPAATASVSGLTPTAPAPTPPGGSGLGDTTPPTPAPPATTTGYTSTNWAGYMAAGGSYTGITGSWVVPKATGVNRRVSADSTWIGIGGVTTGDLIQVGTEDSVTPGGVETSSAFYELLPNAAQTITTFSVTPGDSMSASLNEVSSGQWTLTISDNTTAQSHTTTVAYNSSHSSAEWIEEDPSTVSGRLVPLDEFAPVAFSGATATSDSATLSVFGNNAQPITMVGGASQPVAVPSALGSDGKSFTVTRH